jgi:hypothetical protein
MKTNDVVRIRLDILGLRTFKEALDLGANPTNRLKVCVRTGLAEVLRPTRIEGDLE